MKNTLLENEIYSSPKVFTISLELESCILNESYGEGPAIDE